MNDIVSHVDSNIRINEIRMQVEYEELSRQFKSFLIVEGVSDISFFKKFISEESCDIIFANGKENVIETVLELEEETTILGIVDADFWYLNGINPTSENILMTDFHDIEMIMLNTRALESILDEFGTTEKIKNLESERKLKFREILLQEGSEIGFFRLLKKRNPDFSELNFKRLQFDSFLNTKEFQIDKISLIRTVLKNTENWVLIQENLKNLYGTNSEQVIVEKIENLKESNDNLLQICIGHDLTKIILIMLIKEIGNRANPNFPEDRKSLESSLRMAYTLDDFLKTELFKKIKEWCLKNNKSFFKEISYN